MGGGKAVLPPFSGICQPSPPLGTSAGAGTLHPECPTPNSRGHAATEGHIREAGIVEHLRVIFAEHPQPSPPINGKIPKCLASDATSYESLRKPRVKGEPHPRASLSSGANLSPVLRRVASESRGVAAEVPGISWGLGLRAKSPSYCRGTGAAEPRPTTNMPNGHSNSHAFLSMLMKLQMLREIAEKGGSQKQDIPGKSEHVNENYGTYSRY